MSGSYPHSRELSRPAIYAVPRQDGEVNYYFAAPAGRPVIRSPKIYFINGIRVFGEGHSENARVVSFITERVVTGVYNKTDGILNWAGINDGAGDMVQCLQDWVASMGNKLGERLRAWDRAIGDFFTGGRYSRWMNNFEENVRRIVPEHLRSRFVEDHLRHNQASIAMFRQLLANIGSDQYIVCHSQGNLCTVNALYGLKILRGDDAINRIGVYSLASPVPAWPRGLKFLKTYGHTNDIVTWCSLGRYQSGNDWRVQGDGAPGLAGHDIYLNMYGLNFARDIRGDLGIREPLGQQSALPRSSR